jgi:small subunit ribosomal protein S16
MALKIRLRQQGRTNRQTYRVVVADSRNPRDGKYIEMLGWYNPFQAENNVQIDADRLNFWIKQGAEVSEKVEQLATRAAPLVVQEMQSKRHAKRVKSAAKRRVLNAQKKKAVKK